MHDRIGTGLGFVSAPYYERKYAAAYNAAGGNPVPEHRCEARFARGALADIDFRLLGLFLGGPIFATGLVWIGWSAVRASSLAPQTRAQARHPLQKSHWVAPTLSGIFSGYGIFWTVRYTSNSTAAPSTDICTSFKRVV